MRVYFSTAFLVGALTRLSNFFLFFDWWSITVHIRRYFWMMLLWKTAWAACLVVVVLITFVIRLLLLLIIVIVHSYLWVNIGYLAHSTLRFHTYVWFRILELLARDSIQIIWLLRVFLHHVQRLYGTYLGRHSTSLKYFLCQVAGEMDHVVIFHTTCVAAVRRVHSWSWIF